MSNIAIDTQEFNRLLQVAETPVVLFESFDPGAAGSSCCFIAPMEVVCAQSPADVPAALDTIQRFVASGGYAAGFIGYEAAAGLDPDLAVHAPDDVPCLWFGLFAGRHSVMAGALQTPGVFTLSDWTPSVDQTAYAQAIDRIQHYLTAGDSYQVNYTFRFHARMTGDDFALYRAMTNAQPTGYCAYCRTGRFNMLSASPELFFALRGGVVTVRPMKGTIPRGRNTEEDARNAERLLHSEKDRSENLMIVDLLRNDLGRISEIGSVEVSRVFAVERYRTIFQMTSTVSARLRPQITIQTLLQALFPSGSVTGAPKIRSMQIIRELEAEPRHVYTGAVGWFGPGQEACFNVAIRTLLVDRATGAVECGVGSGITVASQTEDEYAECLAKVRFLEPQPAFQLLETLLHEKDSGYFLLDRHMQRLGDSALYFGFPWNEAEVRTRLADAAAGFPGARTRVRLLVDSSGQITVEHVPLAETTREMETAGISPVRVHSQDVFLFHKTTCRKSYEAARLARSGCDHVVLVNERDEVTESDIANIAVRLNGIWFTPLVSCGLLAGTYRSELLVGGWLRERVITRGELLSAGETALFNSVRKWWTIRMVE